SLIDTHAARVEVQPEQLVIHLAPAKTPDRQRANGDNILNVQWRKTPLTRRREILLPAGIPPQHARPIRSETRALLAASIARGRRWLSELLADANANAEGIAKGARCSVRKVNMTTALPALAPGRVKAAVAGRLPHGMGVARLADMPAEWSRQHQMLGLPSAVGCGWLATALKRRAGRLILFDLEIYCRLLTAVTFNLLLKGLSFIERCQSGTFDGTDVYEHIFSASLRLNEPVAFGRIEPLHSAGSHAGLLLNRTATE